MTCSLSIILPTYNGSRYLVAQIDSILGQTFTDFELLIADDGSSDDTLAILADQARRDVRVRIVPTHGNLGQKQRLWQLVTAGSADRIAISDQDDVWHEAKLQRLLDAMGDVDLVFGPSWLIDAGGAPLGRTILHNLPPLPAPGDRLLYLFKPSVSAHAAIFRRRILTEGSFQRPWPFDWLHSLDAAFGSGIRYVDDAITYHRMHDANQVNGSHVLAAGTAKPLRRASLWKHFAETYWRRDAFMHTVGHLAHSSLMSPAIRRTFAEVHGRCHYHWYERPAPVRINDRHLFAFVVNAIAPLAGSDEDLANAKRFLSLITTGPLHYRRLLRHFGKTDLASIPY